MEELALTAVLRSVLATGLQQGTLQPALCFRELDVVADTVRASSRDEDQFVFPADPGHLGQLILIIIIIIIIMDI